MFYEYVLDSNNEQNHANDDDDANNDNVNDNDNNNDDNGNDDNNDDNINNDNDDDDAGSEHSATKNDEDSREESMNSEDFLNQHNDTCDVCSLGGELLCCSTCNLVFHLECVRPALKELPPGMFWTIVLYWNVLYCIGMFSFSNIV